MKFRSLVSLMVLVLVGSAANAYTLSDVVVEGVYGSGDNTGLLVVDFWPQADSSDSFAFEVEFDGSINGFQLMDIVANNDNDFSYVQSDGSLTDITYVTGGTTYHTGSLWPDSWWSQWNSSDYGENWGWGNGAGSDTYGNGDTLGWLAKPGDDWTSEPVTPIPEPTTVVLLGLGGLLLRRRMV